MIRAMRPANMALQLPNLMHIHEVIKLCEVREARLMSTTLRDIVRGKYNLTEIEELAGEYEQAERRAGDPEWPVLDQEAPSSTGNEEQFPLPYWDDMPELPEPSKWSYDEGWFGTAQIRVAGPVRQDEPTEIIPVITDCPAQ